MSYNQFKPTILQLYFWWFAGLAFLCCWLRKFIPTDFGWDVKIKVSFAIPFKRTSAERF